MAITERDVVKLVLSEEHVARVNKTLQAGYFSWCKANNRGAPRTDEEIVCDCSAGQVGELAAWVWADPLDGFKNYSAWRDIRDAHANTGDGGHDLVIGQRTIDVKATKLSKPRPLLGDQSFCVFKSDLTKPFHADIFLSAQSFVVGRGQGVASAVVFLTGFIPHKDMDMNSTQAWWNPTKQVIPQCKLRPLSALFHYIYGH